VTKFGTEIYVLNLWAEDRLKYKMKNQTPGGAQTNFLRFTIEIFVYRWLLLVSIIIIMIIAKEFIIPEFFIIILYYLFP